MISINRVFAMVYRYWIGLMHNWDRLSDMFYWPAMDLFVWGLTGLYFAQLGTNDKNAVFFILTGVIFWLVIWRAQYEINVNLLQELWDKNLVNIFASPLTLWEWILSFIIVGFIKMGFSFVFVCIMSFILYQYQIFSYGFMLIPALFSLLLTGWAIGFFVAGFLIRYGQKIQTLAWTGASLIAPFSALYYPLSILPEWAQTIALGIPSTYVFEALRESLVHGSVSYDKIIISFALNFIYLLISILFFVQMFKKSRALGLGRLI